MIKRVLAIMLAVMMLAGCQSSAKPKTPSEPIEIDLASTEGYTPTIIDEVVKDGVMQFKPLDFATFTMDYEPRQGSFVVNHFGLDFVFPCDTNWLGDEGLKAKFDLNEKGVDVYGSVDITTAPRDFKEYYGTEDMKTIAEKVSAEFITAESYYNETLKAVKDSGFEVVKEGYGQAFPESDVWNAFYIEYIDSEKNNCAFRLYLCNDEINENFYSMEVKADVPKDETDKVDMFRSIIFSLHGMAADDGTISGVIG